MWLCFWGKIWDRTRRLVALVPLFRWKGKQIAEASFFFSDKKKTSYFRVVAEAACLPCGQEASRADACMSVVAVLRPSYYLVINLQSKVTDSGPVLVSLCLPNCALILQCICRAFPNWRPALLSPRKSFQDGTKTKLQKFCNTLTTSHFQYDPEHLAALQTLIVIYNQGGNSWREWVKNLLV